MLDAPDDSPVMEVNKNQIGLSKPVNTTHAKLKPPLFINDLPMLDNSTIFTNFTAIDTEVSMVSLRDTIAFANLNPYLDPLISLD